MTGPHDVELRIAVAEGILAREDADALAAEARLQGRSPLLLLRERGRLSEETFVSLAAEALNGATQPGVTLGAGHADAPPPDAPASDVPAFPVPSWDRYTSVRFLGQGGMGKVFLARDPRLRREVAIKFVHGDNPEHVRRLIVEARAQARVDHDRVCKVHEVGEVEGKVYIAMQYIDGKPLSALAGELTIEQKVMLVRGAAEGIHEAHRVGIIHRDVKPSNIMVEQTEDGALRPYVMDFGLARSVQDDGATLSGTVLGTPRYMAPEQADGETGKLDRRADVYSLGATLYHVLTGEPPIPGTTLMEVMHHLGTTEPRSLRALDADIPIDLEAIVLKCLEKDRSRRYDSARALADDLGRFLDGEPVVARPAGVWYRLRKRIVKHKRLVAAGAVALVALAVSVGWGIYTRSQANERERLARRFTEQVERIEATARYSALSPSHDIRSDQAAIRTQMAELDGEIREAGAVAAGPGYYALGRGYLSLDDDARARAHLESAWQAGFREPRVAYALALALGHLYQQNLLAAERIDRKELREARKREIEQQYRDPALDYLTRSEGVEVPSPEYVAALKAYYAGHLDEALHHLDAIGSGLSWFYEAPELRGDILLARARGPSDQGDRERARCDFEAGREAYQLAGTVGRSVPAVYESLGELEYAVMMTELYGKGDVLPQFDRVVAATAHALAIMPDHYAALVLEARAYRRMAESKARQGSDTEAWMTKAIADAQRAVVALPERPQARLELARIYGRWGDALQSKNQDPSEQLGKAVEISETITSADRDGEYYGNLGLVFSVWAAYDEYAGDDAQGHRSKSIEAYARALQINDKLDDVWMNLGLEYFKRASGPRAKDPDDDLAQAIRALDMAWSLHTKYVVPYFLNKGETYRLIAKRKRSRGLDATPDLMQSLEMYKAGLAVDPNEPLLHNGIGIALMEQAREAWYRGSNPESLMEEARADFEQAIAVAPAQWYGYSNLGDMLAQRARMQRSREEDPSASVRAAVAALTQALERDAGSPTSWANLGMAHATLAAYELDHGRDPAPGLAAASSAIQRALEKDPKHAFSHQYLGEVRGLLARLQARRGQGKPEDFDEAAKAFQQAIDLAPEELEYPLGLAQFCRAWTDVRKQLGQDPEPPLQRGLDLVNRVLAQRPTWPDAQLLRANLLLSQAQHSTDIVQQRAHAARADEDFTRALAASPALEKVWKDRAAQAHRLAAQP